MNALNKELTFLSYDPEWFHFKALSIGLTFSFLVLRAKILDWTKP